MKKFIIALVFGLTIGIFNVNTVEAQHVSIHFNIDHQPAWGPCGYDYAAFYYFPELNIYYDVNNALFYYLSGRRWISCYYLPIKYHRHDFYSMYKVVINDYHTPWMHNRSHRKMYTKFRHDRTQIPIRHIHDRRYNKARGNTRAWVEPRNTPNNYRSNNNSYSNNHRNRENSKSDAYNKKNEHREIRNNNQAINNSRSSNSKMNTNQTISNRNTNRSNNASSVERSNRSDNKNRNSESTARSSRQSDRTNKKSSVSNGNNTRSSRADSNRDGRR